MRPVATPMYHDLTQAVSLKWNMKVDDFDVYV